MLVVVTIKDMIQLKQQTRYMDFTSFIEAQENIKKAIFDNIRYQQEFKIKIENSFTNEIVYFNNSTYKDFV